MHHFRRSAPRRAPLAALVVGALLASSCGAADGGASNHVAKAARPFSTAVRRLSECAKTWNRSADGALRAVISSQERANAVSGGYAIVTEGLVSLSNGLCVLTQRSQFPNSDGWMQIGFWLHQKASVSRSIVIDSGHAAQPLVEPYTGNVTVRRDGMLAFRGSLAVVNSSLRLPELPARTEQTGALDDASTHEQTTVPDVTGDTQAAAIEQLRAAGFRVTISRAPNAQIPLNKVVATTPAAESRAAIGDTVAIYVSAGLEGERGHRFRTPGRAVYCYVTTGEVEYGLQCWTPNDGFLVTVGSEATTLRGGTPYVYDPELKGTYHDSYSLLNFGQTWRSQDGGFHCRSSTSGLTCENAQGAGFWLGRYAGYRLF